MEGFGKFTWGNSKKRYVGHWKRSMMDGKGTFTWENGQKYVGNYRKDKKHGNGILYMVDETRV